MLNRSSIFALTAVAVLGTTALAPTTALAAINYNSSKSNSGNFTVSKSEPGVIDGTAKDQATEGTVRPPKVMNMPLTPAHFRGVSLSTPHIR